MRVLIDTNVLISAALFPQSTPAQAFWKANTYPFQAVICEQNLDEMKRIFTKKFPDKLQALESFISNSLLSIEIVDTPEIPVEEERSIRDMMDRPILRSAIVSGVDIILTGDKDFLESGIDHPRIMTPSDFCLFVRLLRSDSIM
jgi:putative PIN family toxin of toxin-antitoxin system